MFLIEITRQVTNLAKKIDTTDDAIDVLEWALEQPGLSCVVAARTDNELVIEVGGVDVRPVRVELGQWVVFDGEHFSALSQEEFEAKYGE